MQISVGGLVPDGSNLGAPVIVPRNCVVSSIVVYSRVGSCTANVFQGIGAPVTTGTVLTANTVLNLSVADASADCEDLVVQVRT
jgi:hypothetical protein